MSKYYELLLALPSLKPNRSDLDTCRHRYDISTQSCIPCAKDQRLRASTMAVLVAAFYLPFSLELESEKPADIPEEDDSDARRVPLIRPPPPRTAELVPNRSESIAVPFDFVSATKPLRETNKIPDERQKSIVDTRKQHAAKESVVVNTILRGSERRRVPELHDMSAAPPSPQQAAKRMGPDVERLAAVFNREPGTGPVNPPRNRRKTLGALGFGEDGAADRVVKSWGVIPQPAGNGGLYNAISRAVSSDIVSPPRWFGLLGIPTDELGPDGRAEAARKLAKHECSTVYVSDEQYVGHYNHYCKEFLWPTFHAQVPDIPKARSYEESSWGDYTAVNQAIADAVVKEYKEGDTIWVHDYHLMLVPNMIRQKLPHAKIGFFMHISFPTSEVFRCLAYRADLLRGLLAANSIGFQNSEYAQHFMMTAARILALDTGPMYVQTPERDVLILECPIGIDPERLDSVLQTPMVQSHRKIIRDRWPTQKIIGSRDKVDSIKGLRHKLHAFDLFLAAHPYMASQVVLIQVLLSTAGSSEIEAELASSAEQINSRYGDIAAGIQPVVLLRQDIVFEQYIALLTEADAFVVASLRDGMNLTCHEFIYCNDEKRMGPVILSEFTGSASVLGDDALLVNPWDKKRLADAFYEAITMPEAERQLRMDNLRNTVLRHTCKTWVSVLLDGLNQAWEDDQARMTRKPDVLAIKLAYQQTLEDERRLLFFDIPTGPSQNNAMLKSQARTQTDLAQLVPVIDSRRHSLPSENTGSLTVPKDAGQGRASLSPQPTGIAPATRPKLIHKGSAYYSSRLIFVLHRLLSDNRNIIYVASTESRAYMERLFRQVPQIGLVAESGKYLRLADRDEWLEIGSDDNNDWQDEVMPIINVMRERIPIQEMRRHESLIEINFADRPSDVDEERGLATVGEYISVIDDSFWKHGVRCHFEGNKLVIYSSQIMVLQARMQQTIFEYHTGALTLAIVARLPLPLDTDEIVYAYLDTLQATGKIRKVVTVELGKRLSLAQSSVEGINSLLTLLETVSSA